MKKYVDVLSRRTGEIVFNRLVDDGKEILEFDPPGYGFIARYDIASDHDLYFGPKYWFESEDAVQRSESEVEK